ncbi:MAG TPA: thioredoxin domain-containing protein [Gemmatimonadaceae bacterium]|nr:thioredoxin domain-containing protein [Gemmatimonadaceae bacterium]
MSPQRDSAVVSPQTWRALVASGHRFGPPRAPLTIVEFGDFECPVCGTFENTLRRVEKANPNQIAVIFHHWPLAYHRLAYPAAKAAECAAQQGKFQAYHDLLYEHQDSLGLISFDAFAGRAEVPDLATFKACNDDSRPVKRIDADIAAALQVGGQGTPTVIVNGVRLASIPDSAALALRLRRAAASGR